MAGIGHVWGTADELLHPRDRHGRFRKKWKMAAGTAKKILGFLDSFSPRLFQNDAQAAQYLFNAPHTRFDGADVTRLEMDYDQANERLRAGDIDDTTKKFVDMMDRHRTPLKDDIILSRTVGPEAFGLTPQQMTAEDGGLEDFTGKLIADRGYSAAHIGGILGGQQPGNGKITMRMAVPKGTPTIIPARNRDDRGIFLDRDQEYRITKVQPDGAGGYYVLAVATPRTKGQTPTPVSSSPRGVALTPEQREARIAERGLGYAHPPTELREAEAAGKRAEVAQQAQARLDEQARLDAERLGTPGADLRDRRLEPQEPVPQTTEQLPQGVEPRNEPVQAPGAPAPAAPEGPVSPTPDEFRQAVRDAGIPSPSAGPRRREWNNAYTGILSGKRHPEDVLRELERDIEVNKKDAEHPEGGQSPHIRDDIKSQEQLADLIRERYNLRQEQAPEAPPAPTPEPAAPEAPAPVKKAARKAVSSQGGTKASALTPDQRQAVQDRVARMHSEGKFNPDNPEHQRLQSLVDQMAPAKKAVKAPAVKKAAPVKAAPAPEAPTMEPVGRRQLEVLRRASESGGRLGIHPEDLNSEHVSALRERGLVRTKAGRDGAEVSLTQAGRKYLKDLDTQSEKRRAGVGAKKAAPPTAERIAPEAHGLSRRGRTPTEEAKATEARDAERATQIARQNAADAEELKKIQAEDRKTYGPWLEAAGVKESDLSQTELTGLNLVTEQLASKKISRPEAARRLRGTRGPDDPLSKIADAVTARPVKAARKAAPETPAERPLAKHTVAELRKLAEAENVELRSKMLKADIIKEIEKSRAGKATPSAPAAKKATPATPEAAANTRQEDINQARRVADASSEIDEILNNGADQEAVRRTITSTAKRLEIPDETRDRWLAEASNPGRLASVADEIARAAGLSSGERAGQIVTFDRKKHAPLPGTKIRAGARVEVIRRGYTLRRGDEDIQLSRALVQEAAPEAVKAVERVPVGSVPGPKAQVPVASPERRGNFKKAWAGADIPTPKGSAGRSLTEIRDDVASGKITPEEGVRRLETEVSLNKEELADIDATLRGQMSPAERRKLIAQAEDLEQGITAQEKASEFMRSHFEGEAPVTKKELLELELPAEVHEALQNTTPDALKDEAERQGLKRPSGDTTDEVIQDMARQIAAQELERRAAKAAKKAAPAKKATPPKLPAERGKLDARILAEGLGIEEWDKAQNNRYLDDVQRALDGEAIGPLSKNATPAAIGRWLETMAERRRSSAAIMHGGWRRFPDPTGTPSPDEEAQFQEQERLKNKMYAESDALSELAKRLQATRRPSVKAAPAKKVAPAVKAAEARADAAEQRIAQTSLERLQAAKSEQQVREAVSGLTFPELRELGKQHGITGRSKESLIKGLVDRYAGPAPEPEPPKPPTKKAVPGLATVTPIGAARSAGTRATPAPSAPTAPAEIVNINDIQRELKAQGFRGRTGTNLRQSAGIRDDAARALRSGEDRKLVAQMIRDRIAQIRVATPEDSSGRTQVTQADMADLKRADISYMRALADAIEGRRNPETGTGVPAEIGKAAKKVAPPAPATRDLDQVLKDLGSTHENPASREAVAEAIKNWNKADLVKEAVARGIPNAKTLTVAELRKELIDASVGLRLESIATRGFRGQQPAMPREVERQVELERMSPKPILKNNWGGAGGEVYFHPDGAIGQALRQMGDDKQLEVNGDVLANVMGRLATDVVSGKKTTNQMLDELRKLRGQVPDGSKARKEIDHAIEEIDFPKRSIKLPEGAPGPLEKLARELEQIPLARRPRQRGEDSGTSELDMLAKIVQDWRNGELSPIRLIAAVRNLQNRRHESQEGKLELDRVLREAVKELEKLGIRNLRPPEKLP